MFFFFPVDSTLGDEGEVGRILASGRDHLCRRGKWGWSLKSLLVQRSNLACFMMFHAQKASNMTSEFFLKKKSGLYRLYDSPGLIIYMQFALTDLPPRSNVNCSAPGRICAGLDAIHVDTVCHVRVDASIRQGRRLPLAALQSSVLSGIPKAQDPNGSVWTSSRLAETVRAFSRLTSQVGAVLLGQTGAKSGWLQLWTGVSVLIGFVGNSVNSIELF